MNVYGLGRSKDIIWQPFTVKLFKGSEKALEFAGLFLKPINEPFSSRMKNLNDKLI